MRDRGYRLATVALVACACVLVASIWATKPDTRPITVVVEMVGGSPPATPEPVSTLMPTPTADATSVTDVPGRYYVGSGDTYLPPTQVPAPTLPPCPTPDAVGNCRAPMPTATVVPTLTPIPTYPGDELATPGNRYRVPGGDDA